MLDEPLRPPDVRRLLRTLVPEALRVRHHAQERMRERGVNMAEVLHVLMAGAAQEGEWENGEWRYRVHARHVVVVVSFVEDEVTGTTQIEVHVVTVITR